MRPPRAGGLLGFRGSGIIHESGLMVQVLSSVSGFFLVGKKRPAIITGWIVSHQAGQEVCEFAEVEIDSESKQWDHNLTAYPES